MNRGELEYIRWIRQVLGDGNALIGAKSANPTTTRRAKPSNRRHGVLVDVGDDAAVLLSPARELVVTTDMLLEGVHFDLSACSLKQIGRKAMNVNLSDIAAMAAIPRYAVVAAGLPPHLPPDGAEELFLGLVEAAAEFDAVVVGGDTNQSKHGLAVSVTLLGETTPMGPVLRSGARPGDALCVTGRLGFSLQGRHLTFRPRVREALVLHERHGLHAMLDVSDGLGADLFHLVEESGCGAILDAASIPIAARPPASSDDGRTDLDHALNDGEDFELLFAVDPAEASRLELEQPFGAQGLRASRIGDVVEERGVWIRSGTSVAPLTRGGYQHAL